MLRKSLLDKVDRWTLATILQTSIVVPILFVPIFQLPDFAAYTPLNLLHILLIASLVTALHITNVKALQYLEASVYSVLFNIRIIIATFLGIIFLNETIIPLQILGGL